MTARALQLEKNKKREVAREYAALGYDVFVEREDVRRRVPEVLRERGLLPDIVALKGDDRIVFEVKSRYSLQHGAQTKEIAEALRHADNWRFILVYTNPRTGFVEEEVPVRHNVLASNLHSIEQSFRSAESELELAGTFVMAWGVLEAILRAERKSREHGGGSDNPVALLRDSVMTGLISREEYPTFRSLAERRNRVIHGIDQNSVTSSDVEALIGVCRRLLDEGAGQPA